MTSCFCLHHVGFSQLWQEEFTLNIICNFVSCVFFVFLCVFFLERIEFEWWSTKSGHLYWFNSDVMFLSELLSAAWSQTAECESSEVCSVGQQSNLQLTLFCQHHGSRTLFKIYYVGILHSVWERLVVFSHHHKCFLEERWDSSGLQESQRGSLRLRQT